MAVNVTEEVNIRLTLVVQLKDKSLAEVKEVYDWVIGPKSGIVQASNFQVVKQ